MSLEKTFKKKKKKKKELKRKFFYFINKNFGGKIIHTIISFERLFEKFYLKFKYLISGNKLPYYLFKDCLIAISENA